MKYARQEPSARMNHPIIAEMGLANLIEVFPAPMAVLDGTGAVLYANQAAIDHDRDYTNRYGAELRQAVHAAMAEVARTVRTFPHRQVIELERDDRHPATEIAMVGLAHGFLLTFTDVTESRNRARELAATADELAESSRAFHDLSAELGASSTTVAERADAVAASSQQFTASINDISASAAVVATDTTTTVSAASHAKERIAKLADSSAQVEAVSKLINSIAEQTNLLALNATIEAARAGAAGKGFAVVAGEVKELAGRTSAATHQISATIQAIRSDSGSAAESITQIVQLIEEIDAKQSTIAGAVEEQSATAAEMGGGITAVAVAAQSSAQVVDRLRTAADAILAKSEALRALV